MGKKLSRCPLYISPENGNRAGFRNVVCSFTAICIFWVFYVYSCYFRFDAVLVWVFTHVFVICVCMCAQVCCFMLLFGGRFLVLVPIIFGLFDTRRWIKSKNTLRPMLMHHRQKPTEVIYRILVGRIN